jgi:hypothetical protein
MIKWKKASDDMHEMHIAEIKNSCLSPVKEVDGKDYMLTPKTAPSNRWSSMVEVNDDVMSEIFYI